MVIRAKADDGTASGSRNRRQPKQARARTTQRRLLQVAERLFAEQGIDNVSMRQLAAEAGMVSNNVIRYHFTTKENLIAELLRWRVAALEGPRSQMLTECRARGLESDLKSLMAILCLPILDLRDDRGQLGFAQFLARYMFFFRAQGVAHPFDVDPEAVPALMKTLRLIDARLSFLPPEIQVVRRRTAVGMFLNNVCYVAAGGHTGEPQAQFDEVIADVLEMIVMAMLAPPAAGKLPFSEAEQG